MFNNKIFLILLRFGAVTIDAHGLKIQGRGYLTYLHKIPVKAFRKKCQGDSPILGNIAFLLTSFFENLPGVWVGGGGAVSSPLTPVLIYGCHSVSVTIRPFKCYLLCSCSIFRYCYFTHFQI